MTLLTLLTLLTDTLLVATPHCHFPPLPYFLCALSRSAPCVPLAYSWISATRISNNITHHHVSPLTRLFTVSRFTVPLPVFLSDPFLYSISFGPFLSDHFSTSSTSLPYPPLLRVRLRQGFLCLGLFYLASFSASLAVFKGIFCLSILCLAISASLSLPPLPQPNIPLSLSSFVSLSSICTPSPTLFCMPPLLHPLLYPLL